ncbi:MAG: dCMP deaminase family protein [Salinivirgaceae bacterium]|jgi:dCMP deaminase|nr:dCMP deaminase family protein [Salinivirgaceae bacterium]
MDNRDKIQKQLQFDKSYLEMAKIWAQNSYCKRKQVGALIVKDRQIISDGFNGTPAGFENICENENNITKQYVLHAEANAITKVAKTNNSSENGTLYVTMSPCIECSKLIIQAGIKRVVFAVLYSNHEGLVLLERAGVEVIHLTDDNE